MNPGVIAKILLLFVFQAYAFPSNMKLQFDSQPEEHMINKWMDEQNLFPDTLSCWLIAESILEEDDLENIKQGFHYILNDLDKRIDKKDNTRRVAEDVFKWFHKNIMKEFNDEATISDLIFKGKYNPVNVNALYYLICTQYKIPVTLIVNPFYIKTRINYKGKPIDIDILDKNDGFDSETDKKSFITYLCKTEVISKEERELADIDNLFEDYFSEYIVIEPSDFISYIYFKKGTLFIERNNFRESTKCFEKALMFSTCCDFFTINYKLSLTILKSEIADNLEFLNYFQNSLYLLSEDWSYSNFASLAASEIIFEITTDHKDYTKAMDLILSFKTTYTNDQFLNVMNKLEAEIDYDWVLDLAMKGHRDSAYKKIKYLYSINRSIQKYKDLYIRVSSDYCKSLVIEKNEYEKATKIMDSLISYAHEYPIIKDSYIHVILARFHFEYNFVKDHTDKAFELAHKAYQIDPDNLIARKTLSRVYHEQAMSYIRENQLDKAHKTLMKGLEYVPDNKLLNEDLEQLLETL